MTGKKGQSNAQAANQETDSAALARHQAGDEQVEQPEECEELEDDEEESTDVENRNAKKPISKKADAPPPCGYRSDLKPLREIPEFFQDMVEKNITELGDFVQHMNGRKFVVATMCSGTESPILALQETAAGMCIPQDFLVMDSNQRSL